MFISFMLWYFEYSDDSSCTEDPVDVILFRLPMKADTVSTGLMQFNIILRRRLVGGKIFKKQRLENRNKIIVFGFLWFESRGRIRRKVL
jgi:hypothetical protein